jgi:cell division septum initiation protein DivIVA
MSTGDAGRPAQIEPVFKTVRRGFDPEQVLGYLKQLGERVQGMEGQLNQARRELEETRARSAATDPDPYTNVSAHVAALLRGFDVEVERARAKAEADAGRIQAEARAKADLEVGQAREAAERLRADLETLRATTSSDLRTMREHMANSLREIEAALEAAPEDESAEGAEEGPVMVLHEAEDRTTAGVQVPSPPSDAG